MILRNIVLTGLGCALIAAMPLTADQPRKHTEAAEGAPSAKPHNLPRLTPEQQAKLRVIRAAHAVDLNTKRQAYEDALKPFEDALKKPTTPQEELKTLYQATSDRKYELLLSTRALKLEERGVLTPEQQAQADKAPAHGFPCRDHPRGPREGGWDHEGWGK